MTPDQINGLFEFIGAIMILGHVRRLYLDKMVRGVSMFPTIFFTSWGLWNLFYYPHLDQWWSFYGGLSIVCSNAIWLVMTWYYIRLERRAALYGDRVMREFDDKVVKMVTRRSE